jgi:hypothetical protein
MLAGSTGLEPAASGVTASVPHGSTYCCDSRYMAEEKLRWQACPLDDPCSVVRGRRSHRRSFTARSATEPAWICRPGQIANQLGSSTSMLKHWPTFRYLPVRRMVTITS